MCGIVGIVSKNPVQQELFDALTVLQHRGQDAAGIVTCAGKKLFLRKGNGLVRDVVRTRHMFQLKGNMGIGHVRYPTAGTDSAAEAQPFFVNSPYGILIAHNGNLTNSDALRQELIEKDLRHINTESDSELILNVFAEALQKQNTSKIEAEHVFKAVAEVHHRCKGAYAVVALINGFGVVGFRDPFGIRPLVLGVRESNGGKDYLIASETVALDALNFKLIGDITPGEAVYIDVERKLHRKQCAAEHQLSPCIFEFVYLARPDSIIDGISVHKVRLQLGESLAQKILTMWPDHDIDVVMPIPETSRSAAAALAMRLQIPFREGFVKNRYIGRTFIMPGQKIRQKSIRQKLNTIPEEFRGKNVLLVDDSIVRGTTSKEIIQMARDAGAKKVYFASAAPPVRYANVYGIDIPAVDELVARDHSEAEICKAIGADKLIYQDLSALIQAAKNENPQIKTFEDCVFSGNYVTGDVDQSLLQRSSKRRHQQQEKEETTLLDLLD